MVLKKMINFHASLKGREANGIPARVSEIKVWTRSALSLLQGTTISVNELVCHQPHCPPKQVVVLILSKARPVHKFEIHKALMDVSEEDVVTAIAMMG